MVGINNRKTRNGLSLSLDRSAVTGTRLPWVIPSDPTATVGGSILNDRRCQNRTASTAVDSNALPAVIGRWLHEDPIGFDAGDGDLYRYVGNDPTNATDPSGLDYTLAGNKLTLSAQFEVEWVDGNSDKWTDAQRNDFEAKFKEQVESIWNDNPFLLVSKDGTKKYVPQIEISFVAKYTNDQHKYKLKVYKDTQEGRALAFTRDGTINASASNVLTPNKYSFVPEKDGTPIALESSIAAHEFGHLLGLSHPGGVSQGDPQDYLPIYSHDNSSAEEGATKGPNSPAAYEADAFSLMGRGNELRYWMFKGWIEYLNANEKNDAPWTVGADPQHPKYKSFYADWKTYCKDRLARLGATFAFGDIVKFESYKEP